MLMLLCGQGKGYAGGHCREIMHVSVCLVGLNYFGHRFFFNGAFKLNVCAYIQYLWCFWC